MYIYNINLFTNFCHVIIYILAGWMLCTPAYAYLDPGAGSLLVQGLLSAIAVGVIAIRNNWQRLKSFFVSCRKFGARNRSTRQQGEAEDAPK